MIFGKMVFTRGEKCENKVGNELTRKTTSSMFSKK